MEVVLVTPQIPPNTGNIARLCAATRISLHLIEPLGFEISDRRLKRAGLDYWRFADVTTYRDLESYFAAREAQPLFFSKKASQNYLQAPFRESSALVFGNETHGLPAELLEEHQQDLYRIPMFHSGVRSLNLSNAVAVVVYEALRQLGRLDGG